MDERDSRIKEEEKKNAHVESYRIYHRQDEKDYNSLWKEIMNWLFFFWGGGGKEKYWKYESKFNNFYNYDLLLRLNDIFGVIFVKSACHFSLHIAVLRIFKNCKQNLNTRVKSSNLTLSMSKNVLNFNNNKEISPSVKKKTLINLLH